MADWSIQAGNITIRRMEAEPKDFRLFLQWMTDPQTMRYWEGMTEQFTYERVEKEYDEHLREQVEPCIIEYGNRAIGYCQFCVLTPALYEVPEDAYYSFAKASDLVYGIDIFLGEVKARNQGIGAQCLKALMGALFLERYADVLMIDPKVHNARAIRCYHKCGFRDLFVAPRRELQDGLYHDSLIMGVKREEFAFLPGREPDPAHIENALTNNFGQ